MATTGSGVPYILTTTPQVILTAAENELVIITRLQGNNLDTVARKVTLYQVPAGDSPSDTENMVHRQTIYAGQSTSIDFSGAVAADGAIYAKADASSEVILSVNSFKSDQLT